jgi:Ca2+-binding EF-hand superfamily protein
MQLVAGPVNYGGYPGGNITTSSLIKHLGGKDGKLDLRKLPNADDLVAKLDANDDETLDATELAIGNAFAQPLPRPGQPVMMPGGRSGRPGVATGDSSFFLVPKETGSARLTERLALSKDLINRYDKDKSGKLTRDEIGLDAESFKALDRNGDGVLDSVELLRYFVVAPDVELTVHFGKRDGKKRIELTRQRKSALEETVRPVGGDALMLAMSTLQLEMHAAETPGVSVQTNQQRKMYFDQIFNMVDTGKKGVVDLKEVQKQPNFQYMRGLLEMADRDGDGKVTKQEWDDSLDMQAQAYGTTMTLTISETSKGLFELLDTNRDGRLSIRELRAAAKVLAEYDINKDGILSEDEIPVQIQLAVTPGSQPYYNPRQYQQQQPVRISNEGPLWFRKMDRNGDGDVSRREFLGSPEDFKKLDLDGDGFISLEEAIKADAALRAKKKK